MTPDDYEGKKEYKTTLRLNKQEHAKYLGELQEVAQKAFDEAIEEMESKGGKFKAKAKEMSLYVPFEDEYDDDGEETGYVLVKYKAIAEGITNGKPWKRNLPIFDSQNKQIKDKTGLRLWGGSIIRVEASMNPFSAEGLKKAGVSLRLESVQIIELAQGTAGSAFGVEEDGYVSDEPVSAFEEEDTGSPIDDEDVDF